MMIALSSGAVYLIHEESHCSNMPCKAHLSDGTQLDILNLNTELTPPPRIPTLRPPFVRLYRPRPHHSSVSKAQLAKLYVIFENIDVSKSGTVYCSDILSVVDMAQSPFTDNLFKLVGKERSCGRFTDRWMVEHTPSIKPE